MTFSGFKAGVRKNTTVPGQFFSELLAEIDDLAELKLTLFLIWRLNQIEGAVRFVRESEIAQDPGFMAGIHSNPEQARDILRDALARAVRRGTFLQANAPTSQEEEPLYFLNSPKGRAAADGLQAGRWKPEKLPVTQIQLEEERPNIFTLYEAHIGPLTPMIAEILQEAEEQYPAQWIEDAVRIAVENNVRRWRYIEAILKSWQEKGRDDQKDRRDPEKDRRKFVNGEFSDFIEH
jgi:DnaD/phage-associated family protein